MREPVARGGISWIAAATGLATALGAIVLLGAVTAAVLAAVHARTDALGHNATLRAAVAIAGGIVVVELVAFVWGGYAAGRMARGAGVINGMLVGVLTLVVAGAAFAVAWSLDLATRVDVAFPAARLNLSHDRIVQMGTVLFVASLVAMFAGGAVGGGMGARWHSKLERTTMTTRSTTTKTATATPPSTVDLRDRERMRDRTVVEEPADVESPARR